MRNIVFIVLVFIGGTLFPQMVTVTITPTEKKQTIRGFTSYIESSGVSDLGNLRDAADLGISAFRFRVLRSKETGVEDTNDNADPFNLDLTKFSYSTDKVNFNKALKDLGVKTFFCTISTPPKWMKRTDTLMYGGSVAAAQAICGTNWEYCGGKLRSDMYDEFAEWALGLTKKFKEQMGFDLTYISPQNEPEFKEPYSSCVYTASELMLASKKIGQRFNAEGITTKIFHGEILPAQGRVLNFFQAVNNDSECKNYVSAFAIHNYDADGIHVGGAGASQWQSFYTESQRVTPVKELWMTETSGYNPTITDAVKVAAAMYNALYYGNITLWSYHVIDTTHRQVYYAQKQFSRFIRPYSERVQSVADNNDVLSLAFKNDSIGSFTIILINTNAASSKQVKVNLPSSPGMFDIFRTSETEFCSFSGQTDLNSITLPPNSINTLINYSRNKLPAINPVDTLIVIKNTSGSINLSGISDGGEGNQTLSMWLSYYEPTPKIFNSISINYTSPNTIGKINYTLATDITGSYNIKLTVDDHDTTDNGFYSQKVITIPFIVIPFINAAPSFNDVDDQTYTAGQFNTEQLILLSGVNDGNGGKQKLTLSATSSDPSIASITPQGTILLKITPKKNGTVTITVILKDDGDTYLGGINSVTKTFKIIAGTGIDALEKISEKVSLYPNPASSVVTIVNPEIKYSNVQIINITGKIVLSASLTDVVNLINIDQLPGGLYIVRLINKMGTKETKIVIE